MPAGNRRLPRPVRTSVPPVIAPLPPTDSCTSKYSVLGSVNLTGLEQPVITLKHFPFPNTPVENDLIFELLMFLYTSTAAALQFLQLYRSVWWLPHSFNIYAVVSN